MEWTGNLLLALFTLGLAMPWVIVRTVRFWTDNVRVDGVFDLAAIEQQSLAVSAVGEGFADFLGFDFGF